MCTEVVSMEHSHNCDNEGLMVMRGLSRYYRKEPASHHHRQHQQCRGGGGGETNNNNNNRVNVIATAADKRRALNSDDDDDRDSLGNQYVIGSRNGLWKKSTHQYADDDDNDDDDDVDDVSTHKFSGNSMYFNINDGTPPEVVHAEEDIHDDDVTSVAARCRRHRSTVSHDQRDVRSQIYEVTIDHEEDLLDDDDVDITSTPMRNRRP